MKSTNHCTALKQSCGSEALNVTLEKDDIDGNTPMLRGQGTVYFGHSSCDITSTDKKKKRCYNSFLCKAFSIARSVKEEEGMVLQLQTVYIARTESLFL